MTKDDILRIAEQSDAYYMFDEHIYNEELWTFNFEELERFAALVAAAERNRKWTHAHWTEYERSIAAAEREACAKVCDEEYFAYVAADAIRARGEK